MKNINNINTIKLLKEEIIKSKIENSFQTQLNDYIFLQNKVNSIKKILTHKPGLAKLDYSQLNKYYNCSKRIIISKKREEFDDIDLNIAKHFSKNKRNNTLDYQLNLKNPILNKLLKSKLEEDKIRLNTEETDTRNYNTFYENNISNDKKQLINLKNNYTSIIGQKDLYKLPKQIKNKYVYNLTDIQKNAIKKKYQIKGKLSKFDRYAKYFIRGLSMSEEQNAYYQKCKKIDLSLTDDKKTKARYIASSYDYKRNKNNKFITRIETMRKKKVEIEKNDFVQNYNRTIFKYSLKDLLTKENPIKIILKPF